MTHRAPLVLFAAAAGPRRGFGHLVRCGVLADALGASRHLVLRGARPTLHAAIRFGWTVHQGRDILAHLQPDLLVVDDPSPVHTARWVRLARREQVPVAAVYDGGSLRADADLVIDGSLSARAETRSNRLSGPSFSILRSDTSARIGLKLDQHSPRILVALGGGAYVRRLGVDIAAAIVRAVPRAHVELAAGFAFSGTAPELPRHCCWVQAPDGLSAYLAVADVAVVAGGITLYESCALGTPTVGVPVVPAQRATIRAASAAGAVMGVLPRTGRTAPAEIADAVAAVLAQPMLASALSRRARRLVDGGGTARVVARLRGLIDRMGFGRWPHAA